MTVSLGLDNASYVLLDTLADTKRNRSYDNCAGMDFSVPFAYQDT